MIKNNERIQSMLHNILEQVRIIMDDFNINGETHYDYIIEKLDKANWDLNILLNMAKEVREDDNRDVR